MRTVQYALKERLDRATQTKTTQIRWPSPVVQDLVWWLHSPKITLGRQFSSQSPHLILHTDASLFGWGATLWEVKAQGVWPASLQGMSIKFLELWAVLMVILSFAESLVGQIVGLMSDNTTALAYLTNEVGTHSRTLNQEAQWILDWLELNGVFLLPYFVKGKLCLYRR